MILRATNPELFAEVMEILRDFELIDDDLILAGGEESGLAKRLNHAFRSKGWREGRVDTTISLVLRLMPCARCRDLPADLGGLADRR